MKKRRNIWRARTAAALAAAAIVSASVPACFAEWGVLDTLLFSGGAKMLGEFDSMNSANYLALVPMEGDGSTQITAVPWKRAKLSVTFNGEAGMETAEGVVSPVYTLEPGASQQTKIISAETDGSGHSMEYDVTLYRAQELGLWLETSRRELPDGSRQLCAALYGAGMETRMVGFALRFDPTCLQLASSDTNEPTEQLAECLSGTPQLAVAKGEGTLFLQNSGPDTAVLDNASGMFRATFAALNGVRDERVPLEAGGTLLAKLYFRITEEENLNETSLQPEYGDPTGYGAMPNGAYLDGVLINESGDVLYDGTLTYDGVLRVNGLPNALDAAAAKLLAAEDAAFGGAEGGAVRATYPDGVVTLTREAGASGAIGAGEQLTLTQSCTRVGCTARGWLSAVETLREPTLSGTYEELLSHAPYAPRFGEPAYEPRVQVAQPGASGAAAPQKKQTSWRLYSLDEAGALAAEAGGGMLAADGTGLIAMTSGTYRLEFRYSGCLPYVVILKNVSPDSDLNAVEALQIPMRAGKLAADNPYAITAADYAMFLPVISDPAGSGEIARAADFNGNGEVDLWDLCTLLEAIGQSSGGEPANGDYAVGDLCIDLAPVR